MPDILTVEEAKKAMLKVTGVIGVEVKDWSTRSVKLALSLQTVPGKMGIRFDEAIDRRNFIPKVHRSLHSVSRSVGAKASIKTSPPWRSESASYGTNILVVVLTKEPAGLKSVACQPSSRPSASTRSQKSSLKN